MSARAAIRIELARARRALDVRDAAVPESVLRAAAALLEDPEVAALCDGRPLDDGALGAILDAMGGGPIVPPAEPAPIELDPGTAAAIAGATLAAAAGRAPVADDPDRVLPAPGTRADRPAVDPSDALRIAADRAITRRRTSNAPLPMETVRLFYGDLLEALAAHAPGAAFPDRHSAEDGWGAAHREWREAYPGPAAAMERLMRCDPHQGEFLAALRDAVGVIARGATVIDTDDS